jgi:hypothetical protein
MTTGISWAGLGEILHSPYSRSAFTTWKDGSAILWYRPFLQEWAARLQALGFDIHRHKSHAGEMPPELIERYEGLKDADVARIKAGYTLDYWIVPATHASAFPVAFEELGYKILCLRDGTMCPSGPQ